VLPATLTAGTVLEALGTILVRGLGLAAITFPAGVMAASIPPRIPAVPAPEWDAKRRRAEQRDQARTRKRAAGRATGKAPTCAPPPSPFPSAAWLPAGASAT